METNAHTNPAQETAPGDLAAELEAAKAKAEENYNKFLYAMADFENYKKRIERQFADIAIAGKRSALAKFLPVIDNLERALNFEDDSSGLRGGLQATLKGFEGVLASEGVKPIAVKGKPFDPKIAEAIGTAPSDDVPSDTVVEEVQKGYMIGDELLRPAQVIVAKNE
jgi:molecular chaperone GrpE